MVATLVVALALSSSATPTPPGRNGLIAFVAAPGIAAIRADGSGLRKLTHHTRDRSPAWSPDGRFLAFSRAGRIHVINADGTGLHRLGSRPRGEYQPAWSPDGRSIAFVTKRGLFVMRADGRGARRLFRPGAESSVGEPSWSPDGRSIAFSLFDDTLCGASLVVIGRDGRGWRYLTDAPGCSEYYIVAPGENAAADDSDPDWSPDGTRIAFTRRVWLCESCDQEEIFSSNVDGTDVRWLTTDTSFWSARPSWSPDQKLLAAETSEGLAILNLAGKRQRILAPYGFEPAWQPLRP